MFISPISWNNLLKRLNPTEEPFNGTALVVEFWIEPDRSSPLRMFPGSPVDWDIGLDPSFLIVLTNLPGIVDCICGDTRGTIVHHGNLKYFEGWLVGAGIMGICWCNRAGKGETVLIDQSTQFVSVYHFIAITVGSEQIEEDHRVHSFLASFKVVPVNRRFGIVFRRNIVLGTAGGQDVLDAVDQPVEVTPGSADARLR